MTTPADPFTELGAAAVNLHELYVTFIAAGFTEEQSFALVHDAFMTILMKAAG